MGARSALRITIPAVAMLWIGLSALPASADTVNLLVNGSFENPAFPGASNCGPYSNCLGFHNGVAGQDNIAGWQLIGKGGVDLDGNPIPGAPATILLLNSNYVEPDLASGLTLNFHPQDGFQSVDLTGEGNQGTTNGIKQSVATTPGSTYDLRFWLGHQYSSAPGYTLGPGSLALYIDGTLVGTYDNSLNTFEDVTWTPFSYSFTAVSSSTVIAFLNNTPEGNNYAGLDNVSLTAVPEPSSLILLGAGVSLLAARVRSQFRRK
jgi:hypothetical protein